MRLLGFLLIICVNLLAACSGETKLSFPIGEVVVCSAEEMSDHADGKMFTMGQHFVTGGQLQNNEFARSGKFSCRLDSSNPNSFGLDIPGLNLGDLVTARVWRHKKSNKSNFVFSSTFGDYGYESVAIDTEGDWELMEITSLCFGEGNDHIVKVYCSLPDSTGQAWFDDLEVLVQKDAPPKDLKTTNEIAALSITLADSSLEQLKQMRLKGIKDRVIGKKSKRKLPAKIEWNEEDVPASVRIKGDWTDHLRGYKWSLRMKTDDAVLLKNTSVSIMTPMAREFTKEWLYHEFLMREGVMTTEYDFVPVKLNNTYRGLFAVEDHFTDELITKNNRPDGVILKFDEGDFWKQRKENATADLPNLTYFEASAIRAFKGTVSGNEETIVERARALAYQLKFGLEPIENLMDIDASARLMAAMDLFRGWHTLHWHNLRFYYNPQTDKLEIVAFDAYSNFRQYQTADQPLFIHQGKYNEHIVKQMFLNESFRRKYIQYLRQYAEPAYVASFLDSLETERLKFEELLAQEFPYEPMGTDFLTQRANYIHNNLLQADTNKLMNWDFGDLKGRELPVPAYEPVPNVSVIAWTGKFDQTALVVASTYPEEIELLNPENPTIVLRTLSPYRSSHSELRAVSLPELANYKQLLFRVKDGKTVYEVKPRNQTYPGTIFR